MEELYAYNKYYSRHLIYGIYDSDLLKSLINSDTTLYKTLYKEIKNEMDQNFDPFLHLISRKYIEDDEDTNFILYNFFNPGLLTEDTVKNIIIDNTNKEKAEVILSIAIIYMEHTIEKIVNDTVLDLFMITPSIWEIFLIKLYKEALKEPKYKDYLSRHIDIVYWGL